MKKICYVNSSLKQLDLLNFSTLYISIVPIGKHGITSDRFAIEVKEYDLVWRFPVQWRAEELDAVRRVVKQFNWSLSFENGTPIEADRIYEAFEDLLGAGSNYAQTDRGVL